MAAIKKLRQQRKRRVHRVRNRVRGDAKGKLRLCVFRSSRHIYAQLVDDTIGTTIVAANTVQVAELSARGGNVSAASAIGRLLAERAVAKGVTEVVFDRGPYKYHGRIAALAKAARENGLKF